MLSWLRTMNLEQYGAVLVEQGCDAMQILRSMDSHDIKSLVHVARMKPLHAKVFEREIGAPCPRFTPGIRPFARSFLASKVHYPSQFEQVHTALVSKELLDLNCNNSKSSVAA